MTMRTLGCAELFGYLRHAVNQAGTHRRTTPDADTTTSSYFVDTDAVLDLHGHVLRDLGATAEQLGALHSAGVDAAYPTCGFTLTEKALRLAQFAQELEAYSTWGEAVDTAANLAHQLGGTPDDLVLGDAALLAVVRYAAHRYPPEMTPIPGWLPHDTPLFLDGYPTTLLGHAAAELHVNAVTASCLDETRAVDLFSALGWQLSPRAQALADAIQHYESERLSWPDAVTSAEHAALDHLDRQDSDR